MFQIRKTYVANWQKMTLKGGRTEYLLIQTRRARRKNRLFHRRKGRFNVYILTFSTNSVGERSFNFWNCLQAVVRLR